MFTKPQFIDYKFFKDKSAIVIENYNAFAMPDEVKRGELRPLRATERP